MWLQCPFKSRAVLSESNSFQTLISIPANTTASVRLKYEFQLRKSRNEYKYSTKLKTFNEFKRIKIDVIIDEERKLTKVSFQKL